MPANPGLETRGTRRLCCSFCGQHEQDVFMLIAGPTVFICNDCVSLCADLVAQRRQDLAVKRSRLLRAITLPTKGQLSCQPK